MKSNTREALTTYWVNDGPKAVFLCLYICANIAVFVQSWLLYMNMTTPNYFAVLSYGICLAKASAAIIKLNCACILIPVLRNFLSWLRGTWINTYLPIDKNIVFHKFVGWLIAMGTATHCLAHFYNFYKLSHTPLIELETINIKAVPTFLSLSLETLPGLTGYIAVLILVIMIVCAVAPVRRPHFELFYYTHHLFILFLALIAVHGVAAMFGPPQFWYWIIGPTVLYLVERTYRILRAKQTTMLLLAKQHPSRVIELRMKKATFSYKPGQYLYLNCPYIAKNEWHPFTITSAPEEDFVSVHINIVGNWTGKLATLLNPSKRLGVVQKDLIEGPNGSNILAIDGPFGAASEEVFNYKTVMLVGAGIGVTPFASILKHIKYQLKQNEGHKIQLTKVYFYWVCRDKNSFEWISGILADLEQENINNFLEIHTYLTGALSLTEVENVMYDTEKQQDQITGLSSPTHFGRPKWSDIFIDMTKHHSGSTVGVFFCGPRILSKQLYYNCRKYTSSDCKFKYHKENF